MKKEKLKKVVEKKEEFPKRIVLNPSQYEKIKQIGIEDAALANLVKASTASFNTISVGLEKRKKTFWEEIGSYYDLDFTKLKGSVYDDVLTIQEKEAIDK